MGRNCLVAMIERTIFATKLNFVVMTDYEYIVQQVKKFHYSEWNGEELRKCVDMLPGLTREQQLSLYRSKWVAHEKALKDALQPAVQRKDRGKRQED